MQLLSQLLPLLAWALLLGCGAMNGLNIVRRFQGESLSVTCTYKRGRETNPKFWCKPGTVKTCSEDIIITSESEPEVQKGRFSIRDNRTHRAFTVTVEGLTKKDEGIYLCGVRTGVLEFDESAEVKVIVFSALSTTPSLTDNKSEDPDLTSPVTASTCKTPPEQAVQLTSNPSRPGEPSPQHLNVVEHILTPGITVVLLLLVVAAAVLIMLSRKRKKVHSGAAIEMNMTHSMSPTGADALNYADINHHTGTAESQLYSNADAFRRLENSTTEYMEVRQSTKRSEEETEAIYAKVQKPVPQQEDIYSNIPSAPRPSREPNSTVLDV